MTRFYLVLIFATFILQVSCNSPTEPEFKNPREYTWTATMLAYPGSGQTRLYSIWGSSSTNVYASGFSLLSGNKGAIYHYDGKQWTPVTSLPSPDYNYLWEITGFAANDIWVAGSRLFAPNGDSAAILHYDGVRWTQQLPSHLGVRGLKSVGGISSQELFFGSYDGRVISFNNNTWVVDTLYPGLWLTDISNGAQVFAVGNTVESGLNDSVMCFKRTGNDWELVDLQMETESPQFGQSAIYSPAPSLYYSCGYLGVFRWENDRWVKVFSAVASLFGLGGNSPSNILAVGWEDKPVMYHWDGTRWDEIVLPQGLVPGNVELYAVWTDGKEAFIVGGDGAVSYILHGK